jgi:F-type H+-transporting ATPase subunit b
MRIRSNKLIFLLILAALTVIGPRLARLYAEQAEKPTNRPAAEEVQISEREQESGQETDPTESLRNSTMVKWLAAKTGMSQNAAYWLCVLINFGIVVGLIVFGLKKSLPGFFQARNHSIQRRIEEARKTSDEARRRLADVENRLSRLDSEIGHMRQEAEENARAEEKRMLAEAEEEHRRILASAEQEIAAAASNARRELRAYAAELAVDLAEKKIRVSSDTDQALVKDFTTQLGKDGR